MGASDQVEDDITVDAGSSGGPRRDSGGINDSAATTDGLVRRDTGTTADDASTISDASTTSDASSAAACANPSACGAALAAGEVKGDNPSTPVTVTGTTSRWVKIRVKEDDNSIFGYPLTLRATLNSPPGSNFDLFLYDGAPTQCTTPNFSSTTAGSDVIEVEFGESGAFSNGSDDSRDVYVEVRYASGSCPPSGNWSLTFQGYI